MERTSNRSLWARITFQREIKIGIANDSERRRKEVDNAIKGDIKLILAEKFDNARQVEKRLHEKFKDSRFRIKGGAGGGCTEWFYLSAAEYMQLINFFRGWWFPSPIMVGVVFILIVSLWMFFSRFGLDFFKYLSLG